MSTPETDVQGNLSTFSTRDGDKMALGHTPSTRSAELVAGARAALMKNPETEALSKMSGRIVAKFLSDLDGKTNVLWFFPARMMALEYLTTQFVQPDKAKLLVDIAAGFSPRGLHLARQYPNAEVIEIDLPDVVAEKKHRLTKGKIEIPPNLRWIEADLGKTLLSDALEGRQADMITSEGLTLYLTQNEYTRLFQNVYDSLAPGGLFMAEFYFKDKLLELRKSPNINSVASFVFRMVGHVPGILPDLPTAFQYFSQAGFTDMVEYPVTEIMDKIGQTKPVEIISIIAAHKPAAAPDVKPSPAAVPVSTPPATPAQPTETTASQPPAAPAPPSETPPTPPATPQP